jgi:hypothetical protein
MFEAIPKNVRNACWAITACIAISVLAAYFDAKHMRMSADHFVGRLGICAVFILFPIQLARGNNQGRKTFSILVAIGALSWLFELPVMPAEAASKALMRVQLPILCLSVYWLFTRESNVWFAQHDKSGTEPASGERKK